MCIDSNIWLAQLESNFASKMRFKYLGSKARLLLMHGLAQMKGTSAPNI